MIIGLASKCFVNNRIDLNLKTIYDSMKEAFDNKADAILFGEAFLQGFDALKWVLPVIERLPSVRKTELSSH